MVTSAQISGQGNRQTFSICPICTRKFKLKVIHGIAQQKICTSCTTQAEIKRELHKEGKLGKEDQDVLNKVYDIDTDNDLFKSREK